MKEVLSLNICREVGESIWWRPVCPAI